MKNIVKHLFIVTFFLVSLLPAATTISSDSTLSLLEESEVCLQEHTLDKTNPHEPCNLLPYKKHYLNIGTQQKSIWIRIKLENNTTSPLQRIILLTSPLIEEVNFYETSPSTQPKQYGVAHITDAHHTLFPYIPVLIDANTTQTYYLHIRSLLTPVDFRLLLKEYDTHLKEDRKQQFEDIFLVGFVLALALYSLLLFFYVKDKSYLYYSFYLFALIWQQLTYLGLTQIYFPKAFIDLDMHIPVLKVNLLILTSALFAMHFLRTEKNRLLQRIYKGFMLAAVIETLIFGSAQFYSLDISIATGVLFIVYNLAAGIISYRQGLKQARLFILGFGIVFVSYVLIILDAIGLTSIMQHFQNILMFATALEVLILSLAFADRYIILQEAKTRSDALLLAESQNRAALVEQEVQKKTEALNKALQTKEMLIQEIHHRVKNNLQIILSMIRLQDDATHNPLLHERLTELEHRINAISKTYMMLLETEDLEQVDMEDYLSSLLQDIADAYDFRQHDIGIKCDIHVYLPLKQAVYVGLIINELVTNAYKHAFRHTNGTIIISLYKEEGYYILSVEDSGTEYTPENTPSGLGLKLLHTLVNDQLEGTLEVSTFPHTKYTIRFTL
jgi:two-component sensor histidine kinase